MIIPFGNRKQMGKKCKNIQNISLLTFLFYILGIQNSSNFEPVWYFTGFYCNRFFPFLSSSITDPTNIALIQNQEAISAIGSPTKNTHTHNKIHIQILY